jgi:hypothetical protein
MMYGDKVRHNSRRPPLSSTMRAPNEEGEHLIKRTSTVATAGNGQVPARPEYRKFRLGKGSEHQALNLCLGRD